MGCGGSTENGKKKIGSESNSDENYDRRPKISVRLGPQVKKLDVSPIIIFIFGGPGSHKGRVVDDLVTSYQLEFLSGEDIILQELPKKVANAMKLESMKEVKELVEEDQSHVTMEWVLQCIERRIERHPDPKNAVFLVDYLPNLKCFIRLPTLIKDCSEPLKRFEEKFPVSFALNLAIPADKVVMAKTPVCAKPNSDKMKETGGQGDEADVSRTKRRAAAFEQSAKTFLDYFSQSDRLVTVDVTSGVADFIWHQVHELFCELDFHPYRVVNTVIVFGFDNEDLEDINTEKYIMDKVQLTSIVDNPSDSPDVLITSLCTYIDNQSRDSDSFLVDVGGTTIANKSYTQFPKRPIMYLDIYEGYLESFLPGSPKNFIPKPGSRRFQTISSVENEVCLFPLNTDPEVCHTIATLMTVQRQVK